MGSLNRVILIGSLGRDPEIRSMTNGDRVANLSLATSETWRDKSSGERKEKTEWHRITIMNENIVKVVENYAKKGSTLAIEGSLQTRKWTDKDGVEKYTTEIMIGRFNGSLTLLGGKESAGQSDDGFSGGGAGRVSGGASGGGYSESTRGGDRAGSYDLNDDIPF